MLSFIVYWSGVHKAGKAGKQAGKSRSFRLQPESKPRPKNSPAHNPINDLTGKFQVWQNLISKFSSKFDVSKSFNVIYAQNNK